MKKVAKFLVAAQEAQNNQDWQECIDAAQKILKNEPKVFTFTQSEKSVKMNFISLKWYVFFLPDWKY